MLVKAANHCSLHNGVLKLKAHRWSVMKTLGCFILPWNQRESNISHVWRNPEHTDKSFLSKNL